MKKCDGMNVTGIQVPLTVKVAGVSDNGPLVLCRFGVEIGNFFFFTLTSQDFCTKPFAQFPQSLHLLLLLLLLYYH